MKYLLIGPAYPLRGGIANFNLALYKELVAQGNQVKIFSFSLQYPNFLFPGKTQFETGNKPEGLEVDSIINSINPFNWYKVRRKTIQYKPDVIVVQFWMPFFAPSFGTILRNIEKKINCKVVTVTHNFYPHEKKPGDNLLLRYYTKACNRFIALSKSVQQDIIQFSSNKKASFVPHPIYNIFGNKVEKQEALHKLKLDSKFKYLLFFGIVRKYKGLELLIESIALLKNNKDIKVIVAGEFYDDKEYYLSLVKKYNLSDQFIIHDSFIDGNDIKYYFCASDMVVQPYLSATQSGVTQIAYHFERPMLVTNVGGLSEIVPNKKAGYVTEKEPKEIAEAISDFYDNEREKEFSEFTSEYKKNFGWDKLVEAIYKLVND